MGKTDFYKYFVNSEKDTQTGFYVVNIGRSNIPSGKDYPLKHHPDSHYFNWEKGRYLKEFQLLYISRGQGTFESRKGKIITVAPGTVFLVFPNEWHRYKPLKESGWEEFWVGFNGQFIEKTLNNSVFSPEHPFINTKNSLIISNLFNEIISYGMKERPGYQQIICGLVLQIFGQIQNSTHTKNIIGKPIEEKINKARIVMNQNIRSAIDLTSIANELNISYSLFRKRFKEYTGVSPKQYYLHLKIKRAQDLLLNTALPVQAIAYKTGFENMFYFSKAFKEKTGYSPTSFRKIETN